MRTSRRDIPPCTGALQNDSPPRAARPSGTQANIAQALRQFSVALHDYSKATSRIRAALRQ